MREFHKKTGKDDVIIKVEDILQLHDEKPRNQWRVAVVEQLNRGNDGLVRSVIIHTKSDRTSKPITK